MIALRRFVPLAMLALVFLAIWWTGLAAQLTWNGLASNRATLAAWVATHALSAAAAFATIYAISTALSLPQAVLLTIAGGLLFGPIVGTALTVVGATAGAAILFLTARSALGDTMSRRGGAALAAVREALRRDGFSYLLAIRLVPLFPFWLVNLAASVCGIRLGTFALATAIGIIPGTFVFSSIGAGVGDVLAAGGSPDLSIFFTLPVLGPLVGLEVLSLAPVAWKKWKR
ncbi:MAG: VTT domain-containing protein [Rhodospirillales bacterium]